MPKHFNGRIELDIRDSEPDWDAVPRAQGARGRAQRAVPAWDDLGYATMDIFGGPVRVPEHAPHRRAWACKFSNFHTTALCSPTRASLLTGRNATSNGMATIAEFASGFPGISTRIPFENGFISEVLAEHGYNTYCVGKWHLTPGEECNLAAYKGRWPLGRGFERFYGWLGGETNSGTSRTWSTTTTRSSRPARPEDGYHLADDLADKAIEFIRTPRSSTRTSRSSCTSPRRPGHAPHLVPLEWADKYKGMFDEGYEAIRDGILARQIELGLLPEDTELSPINPHGEPGRTGPDGQPWPLLDTVRPWDSLSEDEQRLFTRMAEVFAGYISYYDDQLGRVLDYLEESGELDNTLIVVISDNGASGEGGPNGSFNEWRFFNGVPDTDRDDAPPHRRARHPGVEQPLQHRLGVGVRHPVPLLEALGRATRAASPTCASCPGRRRSRPTARSASQYVHAVDVVPTVYDLLGIEPPEVIKGYPQSPIEGESFAAALTDPAVPGKRTQFYTMLGQRSIYHDGWLACTVHPPLGELGQLRARTSGSCSTWRPTASQRTNLAAERARAARGAQGPVVLLRRHLQRPARSTTAPRSSRCSPSAPTAPPTGTSTSSTRTAPTYPSRPARSIPGRSYTIAAGVEVDSTDVEGVIWAAGGVPGGHSLYVKDGTLRYTFNWVGTHLQDVVADTRAHARAPTCCVAEFAAAGPQQRPGHARHRRAR